MKNVENVLACEKCRAAAAGGIFLLARVMARTKEMTRGSKAAKGATGKSKAPPSAPSQLGHCDCAALRYAALNPPPAAYIPLLAGGPGDLGRREHQGQAENRRTCHFRGFVVQKVAPFFSCMRWAARSASCHCTLCSLRAVHAIETL